MEKPESNAKIVGTLVLAIVILIAIVATGTYSFYAATVNQSNPDNKVSKEAAKLDFEIVDGSLTGDNLIPGDTVTKTFSIKNKGNVEGNYSIVWKSVTNNFANKSDLIVTLVEDGTEIIRASDNKTLPATTTTPVTIKDNLTIPAGATKNYTLTITYKNTSNNQMEDMGKTFRAVIDMEV